MIYRPFGRTGYKISRLGFGAMRLPEKRVNGKNIVDRDLAIPLIHKAFEMGINYIDTAWMYNNYESENVVGEALKGKWRSKILLSTKSPGHLIKNEKDYRRILEEQLKKLQVDFIDFYHFHGISYESLISLEKTAKWITEAVKAKEEGLIKHISFSFHSDPKDIFKIVDTGIFSSMLCQYNFLDRSCEEGISYAKKKGLGVVVMGPVGGGRIAEFPEHLRKKVAPDLKSSAELALRFVFANPDIDCALSGMSDINMLKENVNIASLEEPLTEQEIKNISSLTEHLKKLSEIYCTSCRYCLPCPQGIEIPRIFSLLISHEIYGLKNYAKTEYNHFGKWEWLPKVKANACTECGICETKCPQKIHIREQLKKAHKILSEK